MEKWTGGKARAERNGSHIHECRTRLESCSIRGREEQARARATARAPNEASVPDSDVLKESLGPRTLAEGAWVAAQESQTHAPVVPRPRKKSLPQAVVLRHRVIPKREIEARELGDVGAFDVEVEGESA